MGVNIQVWRILDSNSSKRSGECPRFISRRVRHKWSSGKFRTHKKGSKHLANKKYDLYCSKSDPKDISDRFNRYASTVKDKEFLAHVSTWLNQKRFEDEETNKPIKISEPIYEFEGIKLKVKGEFGHFIELIDKNGNKYQKHKFKKTPIEKV